MTKSPLVSVVLGSYNRLDLLKLTIDSVRQELGAISHEIIVVDGGSSDGSDRWLVRQKDVITIVQHNRGVWNNKPIVRRSWGYFMNLAFKCAQGKYICMISDDCLIVPGAIRNGCELFEQRISKGDKVGAVAFYWRDWPTQEKYRVGLTLGNNMFVNHGLYLREALAEVNYIDEDTFGFYCADGDLVLKMIRKGYACIDSPTSFIEHFAHTNTAIRSSNLKNFESDWKKYLDKWKGIYYVEQENNVGGWLEKEFSDPVHTSDKLSLLFRKSKWIKKVNRLKDKITGK